MLRRTSVIVAVLAVALAVLAPAAGATYGGVATYDVTITNLATGQPLSPAVAVTHDRRSSLFQIGRAASAGIEAIAEDGNGSILGDEAAAPGFGATDVVDAGVPLTPNGSTVGTFSDSTTFQIEARPGDRFSLAAMLICTNDGFTGLAGVRLPTAGRNAVYYTRAYDAGTERNTELSADIVDPCSGLGPVGLNGDPNGNIDDAVNTDGRVLPHHGIQGIGDLLAAHDWDRWIAKVEISMVPEPELRQYEVTLTNLATGQPLSPAVVATHDPSVRLFQLARTASPVIEAIAEDGNEAPAVALLGSLSAVREVVDVGVPLAPAGTTPGGFSDSVTFTISGTEKDRLSLAAMLICTNDGFAGGDSLRLPGRGTETYYLRAYDAGTEANTELSTDIVDPCSALGPIALNGDPNGNVDEAVDTNGRILYHHGIRGIGDLVDAHDWHGAVLMVQITRI